MDNIRSKPCDGCGEQIVFLKTRAGKPMPVDAISVELGDTMFDYEKHKSHFASCPAADKFRRK